MRRTRAGACADQEIHTAMTATTAVMLACCCQPSISTCLPSKGTLPGKRCVRMR
jgi:hypothetical protein